jgi:CubicO group peptidase (beta-lactamase class C family)
VIHQRSVIYILVCGLIMAGPLLAPLSAAHAQGTPNLDLDAIDAFLKSRVAAYHIPGLSIAIVKDNQVVMLRGYGEARPGQPMTPQTQLYLGSVTKSFTALAVMQLVERGKLELDAPVQRYLPWFKVADPAASAQITVRHLLNHTSGLSAAGDPNASDYPPTLTDQVKAMQNARLTAPVGAQFQYYNQNYRVLGLLIEQVSGQSYGDYMRANILGPLEMNSTVAQPADAPNLAQGHGQAFGFPLPRAQAFCPAALPSGYLISNAEDMAHYMLALLDDARYQDRQLVKPETLAQIFTLPSGIKSEYGMGWLIAQDRMFGTFYYHSGALENFHAEVLLLPAQRIGMAVLANQSGAIPMLMTWPNILLNGIGELISGRPPKSSLLTWVVLLLMVVAGTDLVFGLFRLGRLFKRAGQIARQPRRWQWLKALLNLVIPLVVLLGLPAAANLFFGEKGDWRQAFDLLPDVTIWLWASMTLSLTRGVARIVIIARRRDNTGPALARA